MSAHFHLEPSGSQWIFNLKGGNGEIVLTSERYTEKASAQNGIALVQVNATNDARYDRRTSSAGQPYFVLKATNGQVIGTSEAHSSPSARDVGIETVKRIAPGAPTKE